MNLENQIKIGTQRHTLGVLVRYLVIAMHVAGAIGLSLPATASLFRLLTPFNLIFTSFLLLYFQEDKSPSFWRFVALASSIGFGSEVLGVTTGFPFGNYSYGATLGLKGWGVPLTIGLNWLVLAYTSGAIINQYASKASLLLRAVLSASLMVLLDVIIEPVAIAHDFWSWEQGSPPWQNYAGWWGVAFIIQLLFGFLSFRKQHPLAPFIFYIQIAFFTLCLLLGKLI